MFKRIALFLRHRGRHQLLRGVLDHPDLAGLAPRALADMPIPWPAPSGIQSGRRTGLDAGEERCDTGHHPIAGDPPMRRSPRFCLLLTPRPAKAPGA